MNNTSQSQSAMTFVVGRVVHFVENQAAFIAFIGESIRVFCRMESGRLVEEFEGGLTWNEKKLVTWPKKGDRIAIQLRDARGHNGYEAGTWVPFENYNEAMYYVAEAELSKSRPKVEEQQPRRKMGRRPLPQVDTTKFTLVRKQAPAAPATAPVSDAAPVVVSPELTAAFEQPQQQAGATAVITTEEAPAVVPAPAPQS